MRNGDHRLRRDLGCRFCWPCAGKTVGAMRRGKAEPNRIQFKRGTSSASVTGSVRSSKEAEYLVEARSGQTIYLEVEAVPKNSAVVSKVVQEGGNEVPLKKGGPGR